MNPAILGDGPAAWGRLHYVQGLHMQCLGILRSGQFPADPQFIRSTIQPGGSDYVSLVVAVTWQLHITPGHSRYIIPTLHVCLARRYHESYGQD